MSASIRSKLKIMRQLHDTPIFHEHPDTNLKFTPARGRQAERALAVADGTDRLNGPREGGMQGVLYTLNLIEHLRGCREVDCPLPPTAA